MRKILLMAAAVLAGVVLVIVGLLVYGALNLNSIVKRDPQYVLDRIGHWMGRNVQAQDIKIGLGWGVTLDITGLAIADDPSFSQLPFLKAKQLSGRVEILPLLAGQIVINRVAMRNPGVRILRDQAGRYNISTLGRQQAAATTPRQAREHTGGRKAPIRFLVQSLSVRDGGIFYQDTASGAPPIQAGHVNLDLSDVNPARPFPVKLRLAVLGSTQNIALRGTVGPLTHDGTIEPMEVPFDFSVTAGPVALDRLRNIGELRSRIPDKLSMPDPITVKAKIKGSPRAVSFEVKTDLSSARLVYLGLFNKPGGTAFQISAAGTRRGNAIGISQGKIQLADFQARLSELTFNRGSWSAKVDTNRFDLAPLAKMAAVLAKYALSGRGEAHLMIASANPLPQAKGTIALAAVGFTGEDSKLPGITGLTGTVSLDGNTATLEPTDFNLGSTRAIVQGLVDSLRPLHATYSLKADSFKLAEVLPERSPDEEISQLSANGTVAARAGGMALTTALTSGQGMVSNVPYRKLALRAGYDGGQVNVSSLALDAYGGSIASKAKAALTPSHPFSASVNLTGIDLQQALGAQGAKAADMVRGSLTGQVNASGKGADFDEVKPTLQGNGRIQIDRGQLIGVNLVGTALKKINGIPAIGTLITPAIMQRHPALFSSPDTDLKLVRLSYVMTGPRFTSRDLTADADDYRILGEGWFDMDKNVDLSVHVLMSRKFSSELQAEKKNVVYLENPGGEIEIPLLIQGRLPRPIIQPDIQFLVQRAASHAMEQQGTRLLNKFLGGKVGKYLGGGNGAGTSGNPPSNPLENLFH